MTALQLHQNTFHCKLYSAKAPEYLQKDDDHDISMNWNYRLL